MAKTRSKKNSTRAQLVDHCHSLRGFLKLTLEPLMHIPESVALYYERWQQLDKVLADFGHNPGDFHSRFGVGLAERIHKVESTKLLEGTGRSFFKLIPNGYKSGEFGPVGLAKALEEAYRQKGFGDSPIAGFDEVYGEYYDQGPDLICSELNNFFNGLAKLLRQYEDDQALAHQRRSDVSREPFENKYIERSHTRDTNTRELFSRKCCQYCFRLIPERSGATKSTIGKTCVLHDAKRNQSLYLAAHKRHIAQKEKLARQMENRAMTIAGNANDPELVPWTLRLLMEITLMEMNASQIHSNYLFDSTMALFSSDKNRPVDTDLLKSLMDVVRRIYPPIARPEQFVTRIRSLIDKSQHSPMHLIQEFGWFIFDEYLPFHPTIVATYMCLFLEESWFAQNHAPDYYHSDQGKGRPAKVDKVEMLQEAQALRSCSKITRAQAIKQLAETFNCSPTRVRQILRENEISW